MRRFVLFCICAAATATAAQAQDMPLAEFLARSEALTENGAHPATPEYQRLAWEINEAARLARVERQRARREGRAPTACLRPGVPAATRREVFSHFLAIPAEEQSRLTVHEAYMQLMARKFPCS